MSEENGESPKLEVVAPSALESIQRAEIDMAITTAKKYPRDVAQSIKTCRELSLRNSAVAATCNYSVPRAGKRIIGPSVHFARIVAYSWGNSTAVARVVGCDRQNAHLQGVFHDLQTNFRIGIEMDWPVQAPHNDTPERWLDQMNLAKRGGAAVALRSAIFNVIPLVLFQDIAEDAKKIAIGEGKTFLESRNAAVSACKALGINQEQIYRTLEVGGLESITTDHLIYLHALLQSIKDGTNSVVDLFGTGDPTPPKTVTAQVPQRGRPRKEPEPAKEETGPETKPAKTKTEPPPAEEPKKQEPAKSEQTSAKPDKAESASKKTVDQASHGSALEQVRARIAQHNISEAQLLGWLCDLGTVKDDVTSLEGVNDKWINMVINDWEGIHQQIADFQVQTA